jgi:poly(3-hydroxyalkanoate) synthetase
MGKLDLPAAVDFILKKTGQKTLSIVSHSQGGAVVLSALIDAKAKLESKIHSYVAWY